MCSSFRCSDLPSHRTGRITSNHSLTRSRNVPSPTAPSAAKSPSGMALCPCSIFLLTRSRQMLSLALTRLLGTYVASCLKPAGLVSPASPSQETQTLIDELVDGDVRPAWKAIGERTRALHKAWRTYRRGLVEGGECSFFCRGELTRADELERSFKIVRETPFIKDLPPFYSEAAEFSRIWVSNALQSVHLLLHDRADKLKASSSSPRQTVPR